LPVSNKDGMSQLQHPEHNWWTLVAACGAIFIPVAAGALAAFALIRSA
jgi:hypothetical protein